MQFERVCCLISQYNGRAMGCDVEAASYPRKVVDDQDPAMMINPAAAAAFIPEFGGALILEEEKGVAMEMAVSCMDELLKMCHTDEPLWIRQTQMGKLVLNLEEYARMFSWNHKPPPPTNDQFRIEATRDTAVVIMNSITLVDAFLDANKWMELFPCIISRAKTLQVVHSEMSGHASGSIHLVCMYVRKFFLRSVTQW